MRTEIYLNRLASVAMDKSVSPVVLAKQMTATIEKIARSNPAGPEALRIVQYNAVGDAMAKVLPQGAPKRRARTPSEATKVTSKVSATRRAKTKAQPKAKAKAKPKSSARAKSPKAAEQSAAA